MRFLLLIVPILFLTYPFLFTMDRGNIEILLFISLLFFLYYFLQKKFVLSAIFLSIAIAMKAFPAVFLILYLPEKKYREMFLSLRSGRAVDYSKFGAFYWRDVRKYQISCAGLQLLQWTTSFVYGIRKHGPKRGFVVYFFQDHLLGNGLDRGLICRFFCQFTSRLRLWHSCLWLPMLF